MANYIDEFGVRFTEDKKKLVKCPKGFQGKCGIPDGVREIIDEAFFGCSKLTSILIPDSVRVIGDHAFHGCTGLTSIAIPDRVTKIGDRAFYGCSGLTSIVIPNSVTEIGEWAFDGCSGLTSIVIPNSVTRICRNTFNGCNGLTSIVIPDSVTEIGEWAFDGCSGLISIKVHGFNEKYDSRNNCNAIIETETNTLIAGCKNTIIPDSVTEIGRSAFNGCTGLTSIVIPNSVTVIRDYTFYRCTGLTSIAIPDRVTKIGDWAFYGCSGLTSIVIPNSVTEIGRGAFKRCTGLTSIVIPNSVTKIGEAAFDGCCFVQRLKSESEQILSFLRQNNIHKLYHFTSRRNLESIKKCGGLYSWEYLIKNNIAIPMSGGSDSSKLLDSKRGLTDYVRLAYNPNHPMAYTLRSQRQIQDLVCLEISLNVAAWVNTKYSDRNAASNNYNIGETLSHLKMVNFNAIHSKYICRDDELFPYKQAEILIKNFIPIEFILNIDNPITYPNDIY